MALTQLQLNNLSVAKDVGKAFGLLSGLASDRWPTSIILIFGAVEGLIGYGVQWLVVSQRISPLPYWQETEPASTPSEQKQEAEFFHAFDVIAIAVAVYLLAFDITGTHGHVLSLAFVIGLAVLLAMPLGVPLYTLFYTPSGTEPSCHNDDIEHQIKEPLLAKIGGPIEKPPEIQNSNEGINLRDVVGKRQPLIGEDHTIIEMVQTFDFWILFFSFLCGVGTGMKCGTPRPLWNAAAEVLMALGFIAMASALPGSFYIGSILMSNLKSALSELREKTKQGFNLLPCHLVDDPSHSSDVTVCYTLPIDSAPKLYLTQRVVDHAELRDFEICNKYNIDNTGLVCQWPSEEVLAYFCLSHADMFRLSKRVIELGSGYGLAGLVIAAVTEASEVVISDGNPQVVDYIQHNIDANSNAFGGTRVKSMMLHWNQNEISNVSSTFDLIVASDWYHFLQGIHNGLAQIVKFLLGKVQPSEAIFLSPKRGDSLDKFLEKIKENDLRFSITENYDAENLEASYGVHEWCCFLAQLPKRSLLSLIDQNYSVNLHSYSFVSCTYFRQYRFVSGGIKFCWLSCAVARLSVLIIVRK
ncbi:hypothetical protein GBA52_023257 [Prunus armeniaca]|nr:hypothetical protein GBA52_023257 [Prunus armeniaca]